MSAPVTATDDDLPGFDFDPRTRVVFGAGSIQRLGELVRESGGHRALLVTDAGILQAGHVEPALNSLRSAGVETTVFSDVQPNPTTDDVDRGVAAAKSANVDFLIAVGGGSAMDCAKGVNFLLTNAGAMRDYWGTGKATKPMLPLIAVPTTAGTGSEAQSYALIADAETHAKMACGDKKAACRVAILDPDLTASMPPSVAAATGMDAISHAVESYVTLRRNPISQLFSRRSWRLLSQAYPTSIRDPQSRAARGAMLLGAHLAGAAIENSMLGATHALVNPLTAHYGITHGVAIGIMLPHVVRYNAQTVAAQYGQLAADLRLCPESSPQAGELLARALRDMANLAGLPSSLAPFEVDPAKLPQLAAEAAKQWTGTFNPRPVTPASLEELYRCALTD
ncbi:MAG: iron-containing alcohol dehydrogenase [Planctomycetaceae bacterium]|nr:iron-containing alcohol dehydrogenase [Planctomycetaceae bacterium]